MSREEVEESKTYQYLILLLGLSSVVLAAATLYMMQILSISYGVGAGAFIQSNYTHTNITASLAQISSQITSLRNSINEVYIAALVSFGMLGSSLVVYMTRYRRFGAMSRRYTLMHLTFTLIYIGLFYIVLSSYSLNLFSLYFILVYVAMTAALLIDFYLEFIMHSNIQMPILGRGGMRIEPETPYSNIINLREKIFSTLHGDVRIIDKHFNSDAISNLHRLIETNLRKMDKLRILTSLEMLDAKFQENYTDFKNELKNAGVDLEFMLMGEEDSRAQHERFIFDDERAYKIPPLNIINKKSEHIVSIRVGEARNRFDALMKNATKYDNYVVKQAREPGV